MKRVLFTFIAGFVLIFNLKAQWTEIFPGLYSFIDEISVVNDNVIWMKDQQDSVISITTDGGKNWIVQPLPADIRDNAPGGLTAVSATTAFTIAGMGNAIGVYKTFNGGKSWSKQITGFNSSTSFIDMIYFWNENEGVVIGDATPNQNFEIYTTSDGGVHWNAVPAGSMPDGKFGYTLNSGRYFKASGNNFCFATSDGRIFKTTNKGLSWSEIKTPLSSIVDFDFRDDNHGIISTGTTVANYKQYITSDGGVNWTPVTVPGFVGTLKYLPGQQVYFITANWKGLLYSSDDGQNWTEHPSMKNAGLSQTAVSPNGTIYIGGWGKIYKSTNYQGLNPVIANFTYKNRNTLDVEFDKEVEITSAQDITHYQLGYFMNGYSCRVDITSATKDPGNGSIVHLSTKGDMPSDTIQLRVNNITDLAGFPVIEKSYGANAYLIISEEITSDKTIRVPVAGMLSSLLTRNEKNAITNLTLSGKIDARDVKYMRDSLPLLSVLDMTNVSIMQYSGPEGTSSDTSYVANQMPACSFVNTADWVGKATLTTVKLPLNITSIGWSAFESCTSLTGNITIPVGVTSIEDWAFYHCTGVTGFEVDAASLNFSQKDGVLFDKEQKILIQYPGGKKGAYNIPGTVNELKSQSFSYATGLTSLSIPASVTQIGYFAFEQCTANNEFIVDPSNQYFSSTNGVLFNKNQTALILCPAMKAGNFVVPDKVTTIAEGAFAYCKLLTGSMNIPASVLRIGNNAFYECTGITELKLNESLKTIGVSAFSNCSGLSGTLIIPESVDTIGAQAFYYCTSITGLKIGNSVMEIAPWTFGGCSAITGHVVIPESVISIGYDAFARCTGITELTIGNGVKTIGYAAFTRCTSLKKLTLGSSVSSLDQYVFNLNTQLTKIITKNPVPPTINSNTFISLDKTLCQLVVPAGAVQAYTSATYWNEFNQTSSLGGPAITISFKKPAEWTASTVNIWAWYNGINKFINWPGAPMTDLGNGWYSYTFAESVTAVNIVLSNAGSPQSVDINNITQSMCYEKDGENNGMITVKSTDCSVTGIHENEYLSGMKLFPQPAIGYFKIELPDIYGNKTFSISITDLSGKVLRNETFSGNEKVVERENLTPGFYIMRIKGQNTNLNYSTKLIFE